MKTKKEIFESTVKNTRFEQLSASSDIGQGIIMGYTQCAEDMADKKYTEEDLHTILRLRKEWYSHTDKNVVRDFINSLNKQD